MRSLIKMEVASSSQRKYDPVQITARIITYLPMILLRSGTAWLSFKRQARKGCKTFQKELLNQGIDKQTAKQFTQQYADGSNLVKTLLNGNS